jgi:hypothetical protein
VASGVGVSRGSGGNVGIGTDMVGTGTVGISSVLAWLLAYVEVIVCVDSAPIVANAHNTTQKASTFPTH